MTPLHRAALFNHVNVVKFLIDEVGHVILARCLQKSPEFWNLFLFSLQMRLIVQLSFAKWNIFLRSKIDTQCFLLCDVRGQKSMRQTPRRGRHCCLRRRKERGRLFTFCWRVAPTFPSKTTKTETSFILPSNMEANSINLVFRASKFVFYSMSFNL